MTTTLHANAMGDFIGGLGPAVWTDECPDCGGPKKPTSTRCQACHSAHETERRLERNQAQHRATQQERHARFEAALAAGYELHQLLDLARQGKLPTQGQIRCKRWWNATGEQL